MDSEYDEKVTQKIVDINARELYKIDFRKYCNDLLIVSNIDNITKALIVKSGFQVRPQDNSMVVYCFIDRIYGIKFEFISTAYKDTNGEIEIGLRNNDLSLTFGFDTFDGMIESYPGDANVPKDMIEKIKRVFDDNRVLEGIYNARLIEGLDYMRIPGFPDDIVVCFSKDINNPESVVCRIEDYDKDVFRFKVRLLMEPPKSTGYHIGDIVDASLTITQNGQHRLYSLHKNNNNEDIIEKDTRILSAADFLVRTNNFTCTFKNHELISINVVVRVMNPSGITEVELPAYYCSKCDRYYILEGDYVQLKKYGYICCRIDTYESLINPDYNYFGKLNEKSILMNYGYSVEKRRELSEDERHEILSFMIDNSIITKSKIIDYLSWFININKNQSNKQNAIEKWKKDTKFVKEHQKTEANVYAKSIKVPVRRVKLMKHDEYNQTSIEDFL